MGARVVTGPRWYRPGDPDRCVDRAAGCYGPPMDVASPDAVGPVDDPFEDWVLEAIDALPEAFREQLGSVAIVIQERPRRSSSRPSAPVACTGSTRAWREPRTARSTRRPRPRSRSSADRYPAASRPGLAARGRHRHRPPRGRAPFRDLRRSPPRARAGARRPPGRHAAHGRPHPARRGRRVDPRDHGPRPARRRVRRRDGRRRRRGLERWRRDRPDLVLLDVMLPRLDGLEVLRAIRREATTPGRDAHRPRPTRSTSSSGLESGRRRLRAQAVRDAGARGAGPGGAPATRRGRRRDRGRRRRAPARRPASSTRPAGPSPATARRSRSPAPSSTSSRARPARRARSFARDALLDRVWGYDYLGDSRLVDVAIGRLRAKVEADPAEPDPDPHRPRRRLQGTRGRAPDATRCAASARASRSRSSRSWCSRSRPSASASTRSSTRRCATGSSRTPASRPTSTCRSCSPAIEPAAGGRGDVRRQRPAGAVPAARRGRGHRGLRRRQPVGTRAASRARSTSSRPTLRDDRRLGASSATRGRRSPASRRSSSADARPAGPSLYFVFPARAVDDALAQLRLGLLAGGLLAILLALVTSGLIARGILRPVTAGARAARRIADGRPRRPRPGRGRDELARWAEDFNRMADSLQATVSRLEDAQGQNRRFVADVAHELRTPLTALVAEASLLEGSLDGLPPDGRRAARAPGRRCRAACACSSTTCSRSRASTRPPSSPRSRRSTSAASSRRSSPRATRRRRSPPGDSRSSWTPTRAASTGSSATSSTTRARTPPARRSRSRSRRSPAARSSIVADRGPGVPADALPHLFDRFYKADPSRGGTAGGSSGLGLAIAAEHAALLGGSLRAREPAGRRPHRRAHAPRHRIVTSPAMRGRHTRRPRLAAYRNPHRGPVMTRLARSPFVVLALLVVAALVAACSPSRRRARHARPRPRRPPDQSLAVPSDDATPGPLVAAPPIEPAVAPSSVRRVRRRVARRPSPDARPRPRRPGPPPRRRGRRSSAPTSSSAASPGNEGLVPVLRELPADEGRRDAPRCTRCSRTGRRGDGRQAGDVHRHPRRHDAARHLDQGRHRHGRPVEGVRVRRRQRLRCASGSARSSTRSPSSRPSTACGSSSTARRRPRFGGEGVVRPTSRRSRARTSATSCRRSSSTARPGARRSATRARQRRWPTCSRRRSGSSCIDATGKTPHRPAGDGDLRDRLLGLLRPTLPYTVTEAQWGTLRVYDLSAKDGSPENITEYPVWLTPEPRVGLTSGASRR